MAADEWASRARGDNVYIQRTQAGEKQAGGFSRVPSPIPTPESVPKAHKRNALRGTLGHLLSWQ